MSAKRTLLRTQLKAAGWKGSKVKRRRGVPIQDAAKNVAVVRGVLKMRDKLKEA
jgi:hypothetical protein